MSANVGSPESFGLAEWLAWMEAHHPHQIELGLDRIQAVAARLQITPGSARVITVGGTNGKGSCVAFLEQLLATHGYRVGAYTSPHLLRYNERVRIAGEIVSDADLCAAFRAVYAALGDISLTYFEFGTLAALWLFQRQPLDAWVLEVGLGGRLDAVNIIDADVAVLTTIDLDHQDWLGADRESIGREKAGIFRRDHWAICVDPEPPAAVLSAALSSGAKLLTLGREIIVERDNAQWSWRLPALAGAPHYPHLPVPALPLPSAIAALTALSVLQFPLTDIGVRDSLQKTRLMGRFQQIERADVEIVFDVAHNPQAARGLAQKLRMQPVKRTLAVFEIMADKDAEGIIGPVDAHIDAWFIGGLADNPRACAPAILAATLRSHGIGRVHEYADVCTAFVAAFDAAKAGDRIVVFGSFFTVAAVLSQLGATSAGFGEHSDE